MQEQTPSDDQVENSAEIRSTTEMNSANRLPAKRPRIVSKPQFDQTDREKSIPDGVSTIKEPIEGSENNTINSSEPLQQSVTVLGGTDTMFIVNDPLSPEEERDHYIFQNYIMIGLIALIQGTLDLCLLAYFYIYLYDHRASPCFLAVLQGIAVLPWVCKPLFGMLADRIKFLGYNRKSYIFAISLLEFGMHTLIFQYKFGLGFVITCNILQVACVVFRNVIAGRLLAESRVIDRVGHQTSVHQRRRARTHEVDLALPRQSVAQKYVTWFFGTKALGSIIGAWQSTVLMEFYGNRGIFLFSSILPLVIMVFCSFFYDEYLEEEEVNQVLPPLRDSFDQLQKVAGNLTKPANLGFFSLVLLLTITPALSNLFNFYYTVELKFELATMSKLSLAMSIAYFFSILVVNLLLRERSFRKFFLFTGFTYALLNLSLLLVINKSFKWMGIHPVILCYILHSANTFVQELNYLPLIGACCRLCPEDLESMSYSAFSGLFYIGQFLSSIFAAIVIKVVGVTPRAYSGITTVIILQVVYQILILSKLSRSVFPAALDLHSTTNSSGGVLLSDSAGVLVGKKPTDRSCELTSGGTVSSGTGSHADVQSPSSHPSSESSKIVGQIAAGIELTTFEDHSSKYKNK